MTIWLEYNGVAESLASGSAIPHDLVLRYSPYNGLSIQENRWVNWWRECGGWRFISYSIYEGVVCATADRFIARNGWTVVDAALTPSGQLVVLGINQQGRTGLLLQSDPSEAFLECVAEFDDGRAFFSVSDQGWVLESSEHLHERIVWASGATDKRSRIHSALSAGASFTAGMIIDELGLVSVESSCYHDQLLFKVHGDLHALNPRFRSRAMANKNVRKLTVTLPSEDELAEESLIEFKLLNNEFYVLRQFSTLSNTGRLNASYLLSTVDVAGAIKAPEAESCCVERVLYLTHRELADQINHMKAMHEPNYVAHTEMELWHNF